MTTVIVPIDRYINEKVSGRLSIGKIAKNYDLNFTHCEVFANKIIGLDSVKGSLLFLKQMHNKVCYCILNLKQVESCVVKKVYGRIEAGGLIKRSIDSYLHVISLHLKFKHSNKAVALPFFEKGINKVSEIPELESKTKSWVGFISKVVPLIKY